ncbi:MAG: chemotaxis protein CheB [Congregibacter sp.]
MDELDSAPSKPGAGQAPELQSPTHIVGIGTSAGGLEALQTLFKAMPPDLHVAYVVVQHLHPGFKSVMDELLAKHTTMPTKQAVEGEWLQPDHVYLIPAGKLMRIAEGRLYLSDLPPDQRINLPVNELFRTLAEDAQNRAIGIILSGTGSDGSRGILALKEVGGLVMVQDPEEGQFDGMLLNAINTGSVDFVLSAENMPEQIAAFVSHPLTREQPNTFRDHLADNIAVLADILQIIEEKTSLDFRLYKETTVSRRIEHRMSINRLQSLEEYRDFLSKSSEEPTLVQQDLLIGVTQFFRDSDIWEALKSKVIHQIVGEAKTNETIRVWCTGCSTGEEAYSLAMAFSEELRRQGKTCFLKVFGSDIDMSAIAFAANGIYPAGVSSEIPANLLATYFKLLPDGSYQVTKELRSLVVFASHNLIQDPPFSNMHFVSCRNTLIYLQTEAQKKAIAFFHFSLRLNGYLFLGSAESVGTYSEHFEVTDARNRIYQKVNDLRIPMTRMTTAVPGANLSASVLSRQPQFVTKGAVPAPTPKPVARTVGSEMLLRECLPPTLIVDGQMQIVHLYGDAEIFMIKPQSGVVSTSVSSLVHPDLVGSVVSAIQRTGSTGNSIRLNEVYFGGNGSSDLLESWSVEARQFKDEENGKSYFAVSFLRPFAASHTGADGSKSAPIEISDQSRELNRALVESQKAYRTVVEELDSTSEQLRASNEELMASNEELQSTNEELQSVNEELYSVNSEHQQKIHELIAANDDLNNLLKSSRLAVLFLTSDLEIRRFTDAMRDYISVRDVDLGRPLSDLSFRYEFADLVTTVAEVNKTHESKYLSYEVSKGDALMIIEVSIASFDKKRTMGDGDGLIVSFRTTMKTSS